MASNDQQVDDSKYETLSTGKKHISFSELRDWEDCSYRHNLKFVKQLHLDEPSPILNFGTSCHAACENYLRTRVMNIGLAKDMLEKSFEENKNHPSYTSDLFETMSLQIQAICSDVPEFLEMTFPNWEFIDAEHFLYEPIEKYPHAFKGFIDGIIKAKAKRGPDNFWLLDWKTCTFGWLREKKANPLVQQQLVLYKNFWSRKTGTPPKDIRCGFVLLKRTPKSGTSCCELVKVSVGDVTTTRALKTLHNAIRSIRRGIAIKNHESCKYCPFKDTEHCK